MTTDTKLLAIFVIFAAVIELALLAGLTFTFYRSLMAPRVRRAMNDAYQAVEPVRINLIREKCDGETLHRLDLAFSIFRDARNALDDGRYKRCIELARQASHSIKTLGPKAVLQSPLRPTPPSSRIISRMDYLVWMG